MWNNLMGLMDCNSFFASCEILFREELRGKPVIVLSNNDGCAIALNKEAKALGAKMCDPYFEIRELCDKHKISVFSSNFSLYMDISSRVMRTLERLVPSIDPYSVDESFFSLKGISDPLDYAHHIKSVVEKEVGVPVSVGVGRTKGLCKAACRMAKKDDSLGGAFALYSSFLEDETLAKIPVDKLWGIGKGRALRLRLSNIRTAKDFRDFQNDKHIQKVLTKVGRQIQDELRGIVCYPLGVPVEKKKEIMSSRTFGHSVYDRKALFETIASHASEVAEELRAQKSVCKKITIYVRSNPFKEDIQQYANSATHKFLTPTSNTFKIIEAAALCMEQIFRPGIEYKKSGVRVSALQDEHEFELSLFENPDSEKELNLIKAMDKINAKEGRRILQSLSCGTDSFAWFMNRNYKSPKYTTDFRELPELK